MQGCRIAAIVIAAATAAEAADKMSHSVIGWSADGRYFAFERSVVLDGSGYPMCETVVVDVDSGKLAAGPFKAVLEDDRVSPEHACVAAREQAQAELDLRGVDPALAGKRLKLTRAAGPARGKDGERTTSTKFRDGGRSCALRLVEIPAQSPAPDWAVYGWHVHLECGGEEQVLRCTECGDEPPVASGIRIVEARSHRGRIAVFLLRSTRGFEGMDVTPIIASAHLPGAESRDAGARPAAN